MSDLRTLRLESIQARLRIRWRKAIDAGDFPQAKRLVTRLHRATLAVWEEREARHA